MTFSNVKKSWKPFYFEGNLAWGWINNPQEWKRIQEAYKNSSVILTSAKRNLNNKRDAFGFYHEYNGDETLGEFFKLHNMNLS